MKRHSGTHHEPKKTIAKSVVKAAHMNTQDGHYGSDIPKKKKHGGKVSGNTAAARPDRRARGGRTPVDDDNIVGLKRTGEADGDNKQPPTGYKKGGWIAGAIKHPGAEKRAAARAGETTHEYMEEHKNSPGKAGQRAKLGLRLSAAAKGKKPL